MAAEPIRPAPRFIGAAGAILLISASAALGAYYAFTVGSHTHVAIGAVFAAAALGGEILKPVAVAQTLAAFRARELLFGLTSATLAAVCIIYSFTSELSLAAGSRGDLASQRRLTADNLAAIRERRARAATELQALSPARSADELAPLIALG